MEGRGRGGGRVALDDAVMIMLVLIASGCLMTLLCSLPTCNYDATQVVFS